MNWYIFGFLAPLLWSFSNYIDKYLLSKYFTRESISALLIFGGIANIILCLGISLFVPGIVAIGMVNTIILIVGGIINSLALLPYFHALHEDAATVVIPIFQTVPIFNFVLGALFLNEVLTATQLLGGLIIILGAVTLSFDLTEKVRLKTGVLSLMLLSSFLFALSNFLFKFVAIQDSYWIANFWNAVGILVVGIVTFLLPRYRHEFFAIAREGKLAILGANFLNEAINMTANLLALFAYTLAPLALVSVVINGLQPVYIFFVGVLLTLLFPKIFRENLTNVGLLHKLLSILIIAAGTVLLR